MNGEVTLTALELLAIAALPLSSISGALKGVITKYSPAKKDQSETQSTDQ